jgi:hypothetical protein
MRRRASQNRSPLKDTPKVKAVRGLRSHHPHAAEPLSCGCDVECKACFPKGPPKRKQLKSHLDTSDKLMEVTDTMNEVFTSNAPPGTKFPELPDDNERVNVVACMILPSTPDGEPPRAGRFITLSHPPGLHEAGVYAMAVELLKELSLEDRRRAFASSNGQDLDNDPGLAMYG